MMQKFKTIKKLMEKLLTEPDNGKKILTTPVNGELLKKYSDRYEFEPIVVIT